MMCVRCRGRLFLERSQTDEGWLDLVYCLNCGHRYERVINRHRAHPVQAYSESNRRPYEPRTRRR